MPCEHSLCCNIGGMISVRCSTCRWCVCRRLHCRLPADAVFDRDHGKELLRKSILAHHPDKQGGAGVPFSWQVGPPAVAHALL